MILYYLGINIIAFLLFAYDKNSAKSKSRRIRESVLLGLAFLGGFFGAYLGMKFFRHKTKKLRFSIGILASFVIHGYFIYKFII